jgi:hypothetical protein
MTGRSLRAGTGGLSFSFGRLGGMAVRHTVLCVGGCCVWKGGAEGESHRLQLRQRGTTPHSAFGELHVLHLQLAATLLLVSSGPAPIT